MKKIPLFSLIIGTLTVSLQGATMKFFNENCAELARKNTDYRKVLYTTDKSQLVLMSIPAGTEIPKEIHTVDQILIFVEGSGEAALNGTTTAFSQEYTLIIPAGTTHTIKNTGSSDLKLYTFYTPPHHAPGTVHKTQGDETHSAH